MNITEYRQRIKTAQEIANESKEELKRLAKENNDDMLRYEEMFDRMIAKLKEVK